jgi:arylsulfate sulfotransferase
MITTNFLLGCGGSIERLPATVTLAVAPSVAVLMPGQSQQFTETVTGGSLVSPTWLVNGAAGGSASSGTITASGMYTAPSGGGPSSVQISVSDSSQTVVVTAAQVSLFDPSRLKAGMVTAANIPIVALYTMSAPQGASVKVDFGTTQSYGLSTSAQAAPAAGGDTVVIVAGMRGGTTYHMRATVSLPGGSQLTDSDRIFTTAAIPAELLPNIQIQQPPGAAPADGVQLLDLFPDTPTQQLTAVVTDLQGNVIWYYPIQPASPFPMKLLPNGHMLVVLDKEIREVDLAGNIIYGLPVAQVQSALNAQGISVPPLGNFTHDILQLANGHLILLIGISEENVTNPPGTGVVVADLVVDWDPKKQAVAWSWNPFEYLSLSHAPFGAADWTHANALVYSPDDGNLLVSMRNQDWILKIKYADGAGDGSLLWRLGPEGDFTLPAGVGPVEWNYGQHYPVIVSPNSAGIFSLMFFNNGTVRYVDAAKTPCGSAGVTPCYSSVVTFQLNEFTKEVQIESERNLLPAYSMCCGSVENLSNGDLEYDIALDLDTPNVSTIREETLAPNSQLVWQMQVSGQLVYRGTRIPSLYPGVTWSQSALAAAHAVAQTGAVDRARKTLN